MKRLHTVLLYYVEVAAALFVLLFTYTAIMKLLDIPAFITNMKQVRMIRPFANFLAWVVPAIEILIAILLIVPRTRIKGIWLGTLLMGSFTIYTSVVLAGPDEPPCSCGGVIKELSWQGHLVFNLCFFLAGIAALLIHQKIIAISRSSRTPVI